VHLPHLAVGFCAWDGSVKETKLELEFKQYETYEGKIERDIPTKGTAGLRHSGEGVREDTLNAFFLPLFYIENRRLELRIMWLGLAM